MLPLVETFYSLQGEGLCIGLPSVFVRLGGCNLRCKGFGVKSVINQQEMIGCDSAYAVYPNAEWQEITQSQTLLERVHALMPKALKPLIILTGGEPSLHFKNPILLEALSVWVQEGFTIWVESNGSVLFDFDSLLESLHFTLSVKLSFIESAPKRLNVRAIQNILDHAPVVFKFVLGVPYVDQGIQEIQAIMDSLSFKTLPPIYLMPMGITHAQVQANLKALAPLCLRHGYGLSDRLHIHLWDNAKGR
ncbi:7-carboxy-7-deazaguanine synthase QueE [Helicobacter bizzozeronii]|uniref:7-carboxy-7-deazaguanine synthase QueE n=1 Tax=Helicobacter bizzozeronii TaxID=56877 RepID=UPI000CEF558A|nr:7-carboxy-7-deazaguanine synthase QueE [Helicobacter bizzozeronii]